MTDRTTPAAQIAFDIETLIDETQPASILAVGDGAGRYTDNYVAQKKFLDQECTVTTLPAETALERLRQEERYDVGILANALEALDKESAGRLIARFRDLHTARFVAVVRMGEARGEYKSVWRNNELFGFGLKLVNRYDDEDGPLHVYKYDIASYKKTPEWLNPGNWANPELWNKFRW